MFNTDFDGRICNLASDIEDKSLHTRRELLGEEKCLLYPNKSCAVTLPKFTLDVKRFNATKKLLLRSLIECGVVC
ncbi:MAG TPA: hypothetical protein DCX91_01905 [Stenotrophomonas sp.]|nr:hypothetical protein [Stenotrophomonas sp.]